MTFSHFPKKLLHWYPQNKRDLPWRNTQNPYIIWLSEIILQQTRVAQGLPYFEEFVKHYPTVHDLANAPVEDVLRRWQGLGYYSRARNLHHCAQQVVEEFGGNFPDNYRSLLKLKGVGQYTAAAIASFAFKEKVAVLDGNVFRVLSRYFGLDTDISSPKGKRQFQELADELIPAQQPDEYNQAIMEFGALQCTPKKANCDQCPLQDSCYAYAHGQVEALPVKIKKTKVTTRAFLYHEINCGPHKIVKTRGPKDIWQGLTDFPLVEFSAPEKIELEHSTLFQELQAFKPIVDYKNEKTYKHILSHQKIFSNFVSLTIAAEKLDEVKKWADSKGYHCCDAAQLEALGKPQLIVRYLNDQK
ncbi:A/G-specific adenine glycosylase [Echinicola vietnamensis]|uniref:Adenine DNA glycosylase n=1 Tax=Echinicola vietnamensis (strain DSM 17526 / LMG 23754 / KMM 6221) TaxID=926556 RepID=L0FUH1_ECHVK|nr:A/G-specific adenine glycosylase [Echinicola vietnamensis]AGA77519.1 A/G-specific adenine glycosylase [Echinicola vietnamensis DSM 17526]